MKGLLLTTAAFLALSAAAIANNIQVSNASVNGQNTSLDYSMVNFNVSWENSWRTSTNESNYDGAWVFVKFRKKNAFAWQHATINYVTGGTALASGHTEPAGSTIKTPADGKGIWIYRSANGSGNVNFNGAQLRWNYGVDGVADNDSVEIRVFAVEMVYITQGNFILGSNGTEVNRFRRGDKDTCFTVTSEGAITVGATAGNLSSSNTTSLGTGTIPAAFPKGYNAFWLMKYEISQQQYADFLNNLDNASAVARNPNSSIYTGSHPNIAGAQPEQGASYLSVVDVMSLLDWSAMRPMTEFEFEKACRGANQVPIPNEYPWGNTTLTNVSTPTDPGLSTETWATGNCNYSSASPMRCGAIATSTSNRQQSGATFYGAMEMGGNLSELVVNATTAGRTFTGLHGNGSLDNQASFDVLNWPNSSGQLGMRGAGYNVGAFYAYAIMTSDRSDHVTTTYGARPAAYGGRGVRTAE